MMKYIKDDTISAGERVECYYSKLKNVLSIKKLDTQSDNFNRIVAHTEVLHLQDCEFVYRGNRVVVRGNFVSTLDIEPNAKNMILERSGEFFTITGDKVNAAEYSVCYLNMILAEGCYDNKRKVKVKRCDILL